MNKKNPSFIGVPLNEGFFFISLKNSYSIEQLILYGQSL